MSEFLCLNISAPHDTADDHPDGGDQLTEARLNDIRRIKETLDPVYPLTMDQWRDAFMYNENADKELAWWLSFVEVYGDYTQGMPLEERKQAFIDLLGMTINAVTADSTNE